MKKQNYLKGLLAFLLLMVGAAPMLATDFNPTQDVMFRTNDSNNGWNTNKWATNYSYPVSATNGVEFAANHSSRMFVLQKYTVTDLVKATKLTLTLVGTSGTDALAIWAFPTNDWSASSSATTLATAVASVTGTALGAKMTSSSSSYLLKDAHSTKSTGDGKTTCTFEITGIPLTKLKMLANGNTFTLLITNKINDDGDRKFYSSAETTDANKPKITPEYASTSKKIIAMVDGVEGINEYDDLATAISSATDGTLSKVVVLDDINVSTGINFNSDNNKQKRILLAAGKDNVVIKNTTSTKSRLFTVNSSSASLNIGDGGLRLVIDGNSAKYSTGFISFENDLGYSSSDAAKNNNQYILNKVTIQNVEADKNDGNGYIIQKKNSGHMNMIFKDVIFDNCDVTGTGTVGIVRYVAKAVLYLAGTIDFKTNCSGASFYLDDTAAMLRNSSSTLNDLTISNPISITLNESGGFTLNQNILVLFSHTAAAQATLTNESYGLEDKGNGSTNGDVKLREAKTIELAAGGYATMVLPYQATVPSGVTIYDVNYTSGNNYVTTAESQQVADGKLTKDIPVLIKAAAAGKYKFVSTSTAAATVSGTPTNGALTGVYTATPAPPGSYILSNGMFVKSNNEEVAANNAYVTATGATTPWLSIGSGAAYTKPFVILGVGSYDTIEDAMAAVSDGGTIYLQNDATLSATVTFTKSVNIIPTKAVTLTRSTDLNDIMLLLNTGSKTVTIGSADYALTIDGQSASKAKVLAEIGNGTMAFINTTFKDYTNSESGKNDGFTKNRGILNPKENGTLSLNNVTFNNCHADPSGVIFNGNSTKLQGNITFTNCSANNFFLEKELSVPAALTATGLTVYVKDDKLTSINAVGYTEDSHYAAGQFSLNNNGYGLNWDSSSKKLQVVWTSYLHPIMLHTAADIDRVKGNLGLSPIKDALAHLQQSNYAQPTYTASPVVYLKRMDADNWGPNGSIEQHIDYENYTIAMKDAHAAYQLALRYQLEGSTACADAAVAILNAWATTNQGVYTKTGYPNSIPDPNEYLICIQGYQFANAAELLRGYSGWDSDKFNTFKNWVKNIFVTQLAEPFLKYHHGHNADKHYWLNWDLAAMNSMLSIGILCDDKTLTDYAITYYKGTAKTYDDTHTSNEQVGYYANAIPYVTAEEGTIGLGQCQESGRDQGHSLLDVALLGAFCQMAKNLGTDGEDLFATDSYRAVKMAEYVGKYNLNQDVPFSNYTTTEYNHTAISSDGRGEVRPTWELFYRYAREKGITAKYSQQWAEKLRAANVWGEGGGGDYGTTSTGFDQLGYGTLMYADPTTADGQDTDATDYSAYNKSEKTPESDTYVRSTPAESKYGSDKQMEVFINNGESPAQFYGMLSFKLPNSAVGHVKKAQLRLVTKRYKTGRNINIFAYENFTEGEATYSNQSAAITAATGKAQLATFKPMGQNGKDVTSDATSIEDENKTLAKWTNKIDLTSYVQSLNSQEVNLLLADAGSGSNSNSVQFFTKECTALSTATTGNAFDAAAADLVPQLIIYHDGSSSGTFVIGDDVYDTLEDALAEVADGGTITVTGNATINNRVTFKKSVTIKAKTGVTPVLTRKTGSDGKSTQGVLYNIDTNTNNKTVTFDGITFDENNAKESSLFETSNTNRVFVLNNVTIKNSKCQKADGVLDVKGGGMTLNGVTFQNCAISNAFIRTNLSGDNSAKLVVGTTTFTGCTGHTIRLRKNSKLDANYLTGLSGTITIEVEDETPTITNVSDQSRFSLQSDGFGMSYANGTITFLDEGDGQDTAIDESAYAGKTISKRAPAGDTFVRSDNATSKYGSTAQVEIHTAASGSNDFLGLMSFSIPTAAIGTVVKAQLRLVTKQKKTNSRLSLYAVGAFDEGSATYETMSDAITAARGNAPIKKFRPKGTNGFDITSNGPGSSDKPEKVIPEADRELSKWTNYIDLTSYVQSLTDKNFYLMITETTPDGNTIQFFSKERTEDMNTSDNKAAFNAAASDLVPQLVLVFSEDTSNRKAFYIAGEGSYDTLDEAIEAAQDGDVITVTKNATISSRATFTKSVTLKAESGVVLTRGSDEAAMKQSVLFKANSGKTVTFDGVTFDDNQATVGQLIEVDNNTFVLKNMTVKNSKSSSANGVVSMKRGTLAVEGITFTDCAITNAYLRAAGGTLNFSGSYTLNGSTGNHFRLGSVELNAASLPAIDGTWRIEVESEDAKITNVSDQSKFSLETVGYTMNYANNTLTFTGDGDGQDTSEITVPDGCVKNVVTASLDTYVRKGDSSDNGKKQQMEVFTFNDGETDADFVGLMAFRLPDDLTKEGAKLEKAQLRLVTKRVKGSRIIDMYQLFTDFSESATYDQMEERIAEACDNGRMRRFKARGMDNMDIVADSLKLTDEYKNIENWTNKIDLTSTVANVMLDDGILRFALSAPVNANNAKQFFTKEAQTIKNAVMTVNDEYLIPELTLVYTPGSGASALTAKTVESEANMDLFLRKGSTSDNSISECIEVYTFKDDTKDQDFVGLLSFNLTDEVAQAREFVRSRATTRAVDDDLVMFNATLRLVTKRLKGERDMNVFIFDKPFSNKSTYAELESAIADARANNAYVTFKTAGMAEKDVTSDAGLTGDYGKNISAWTNTIDVTDLVRNSDSKTLNVMLSAPNNERSPKQYFSSEAESFTNNNYTNFIVSSEYLVPLLTVTYRNPLYTDIEERITIPVSEDNIIYDLRGNRVQSAGKGIYIINGRKVLKK